MGIGNMASPQTLTLDAKTGKRFERIARRRQVSVSEMIRLAIAAWAEQQEPIAAPYEAIADLIGVVPGGMPRSLHQDGPTDSPKFSRSGGIASDPDSTLDHLWRWSMLTISITKIAWIA